VDARLRGHDGVVWPRVAHVKGMFSKILIANRGEIACRVMRTAKAMGIATVAVYSEADADALHVAMADEAHEIGPAASRDSYLRGDKIIAAALRSGAQAVHPGYGFLSENAEFAEACVAAGLVFIGPPASAIRAMGGKSDAKALMETAGVPLVPGYHGAGQSAEMLADEAARIGYPVLIKASAGGGGKGMRVVETAANFAAQLAGAKREAAASFGDDRVLIEKYFSGPRHVEIQVFADAHGNCVYLFERDCSIQRRHQKVVEEAPAPGMTEELRRRMGHAAVNAALAVGYVGAGTVEFLLDADQKFYFMEMNTRLQVEHPVTEFITGLDLVEWQIRVAGGEKLPKLQDALSIRGHAIEVRLYAEDAERDFMPSSGRLTHLEFPETGPHVRVDTGVRKGARISVHYDPMIAKLIVWDEDRAGAVRRLRGALAATEIAGLANNVDFLSAIAGLPAFAAAELDTGFLGRNGAALHAAAPVEDEAVALAALGVLLERRAAVKDSSPWADMRGWRLNEEAEDTLHFRHGETDVIVPFVHRGEGFEFLHAGGAVSASGTLDGSRLSGLLAGVRLKAGYSRSGQSVSLFIGGRALRLTLLEALPVDDGDEMSGGVTAPMPGTVTAILVAEGPVKKGQALVVMEAMKMEFTLNAPADGVVTAVNYPVGALVDEGAALVAFEAA
jgi:3-methylcrotonyl-CoA carboxylase alpha subunit